MANTTLSQDVISGLIAEQQKKAQESGRPVLSLKDALDFAAFQEFAKKYHDNRSFPEYLASLTQQLYTETEVNSTMMAGLFLETEPLKNGEDPSIFVEPELKAYVVDENGRSMAQVARSNRVTPPDFHVDAFVTFKNSDLARGIVRPIDQQGDTIEDLVRAKVDQACLSAALAAVPDDQVVTCPGGSLTEQALKDAITFIEDRDKAVGNLFARAARVNLDMAAFKLNSDSVKDDFARRGVVAKWGGANVVKTSRMPLSQVLLTPNESVGRCAIIYGPKVEPWYGGKPGTTGLYVEMIVKIGIGKGLLMSRVDITD